MPNTSLISRTIDYCDTLHRDAYTRNTHQSSLDTVLNEYYHVDETTFTSTAIASKHVNFVGEEGSVSYYTAPVGSTLDTTTQTPTLVLKQSETELNSSNVNVGGTLAVAGETTLNNNLSVSGNITGTLNTAAQPNITSLGTLTSLSTVNNSLAVDTTNSRIGVRTSLPSEALEVVGNIKLSGTLTAQSVSGTLQTASQPNITGVGTLSSLTVNGTGSLSNLQVSGVTTSSSGFSGTLLTASQPNITGVGTLTSLSCSGLFQSSRLSESFTTATFSSLLLSLDYNSGSVFYVSSDVPSGTLSCEISNLPTTYTNRMYTFSVVLTQGSSTKNYISSSSIAVNGTSVPMYFNGGSTDASSAVTSSTKVLQSFVLVFGTSLSQAFCISTVSGFY